MSESAQSKGRTTIKGPHRAAKKFVRSSVTNEQKLHAILKVRECGMAVIDWLLSSWAELSINTTSSGFKNLLIASSADDALCPEEFVPGGNVAGLIATLTELNIAQDSGYGLE